MDTDDFGDESTDVKGEIEDVLECCEEFKLNGEHVGNMFPNQCEEKDFFSRKYISSVF